jgi:hemerythrin
VKRNDEPPDNVKVTMPIKWDTRLTVGNINIDMEHRLLLANLNALEVVVRHPDEKEALKFFFDQFYESARDHFAHEEKIQLQCMYPFYEENKEGHEHLMEVLEVIKIDLYRFVESPSSTAEEIEAMSEKIGSITRDWFVDHIVKSDLKMKGFMEKRAGRAGE